MHFCSVCDMMYYCQISPENPNKLVYYCRKCGNIDEMITVDNLVLTKTSGSTGSSAGKNIINKYTKYDPTLPRIPDIICPNAECKTNSSKTPEKREIISIRYDNMNMKYIYLCSTCDTVWENN